MKIIIASDHAGFELKEKLQAHLVNSSFEVLDLGPFTYDENDDYPIYISKVAEYISKNQGKGYMGIVIGGSGQGEAIVANRFKDVRAIVYYGGNMDIVKLGIEHNNANIISLGARFVNFDEAKDAVMKFLETDFNNEERHLRRIIEIEKFK